MYKSPNVTDLPVARARTPEGVGPTQLVGIRQILRRGDDAVGAFQRPVAMAYYRVMSLISYDMSYYRLFFDPATARPDPLNRMTAEQAAALARLAREDTSTPSATAAARRRGHGSAMATEAQPRLGRRILHLLRDMDLYGGLFWKYAVLAPPGYVPTTDKVHMLV